MMNWCRECEAGRDKTQAKLDKLIEASARNSVWGKQMRKVTLGSQQLEIHRAKEVVSVASWSKEVAQISAKFHEDSRYAF